MISPAERRPTGPGEVRLRCDDLAPALAFFVGRLGFRIETIFPADEPRVASLSGHGLRLRLSPGEGDPGWIRLPCQTGVPAEQRVTLAPNGTRIEWVDADPPIVLPPLQEKFIITRHGDGPAAGEGRAGMLYRDLIPGRLGGRFIASHIIIPDGGPVADWVHFHKISFQLIFCRRGWAHLVYEDQGPPFVLAAGDCVLQPPGIRHQVLESSAGLEVVEVACPAMHETIADHDLTLPNARRSPERDFGGQVFLHHEAARAPWIVHGEGGFERQDTGVAAATGGLADTRVLRAAGAREFTSAAHDGDLYFAFVLEGSAVLSCGGDHMLGPCDAFVIPSGEAWRLGECSPDFALLEVTAPATRA